MAGIDSLMYERLDFPGIEPKELRERLILNLKTLIENKDKRLDPLENLFQVESNKDFNDWLAKENKGTIQIEGNPTWDELNKSQQIYYGIYAISKGKFSDPALKPIPALSSNT